MRSYQERPAWAWVAHEPETARHTNPGIPGFDAVHRRGGTGGHPGEAHATVHRALTGLLDDGIVGRVSHATAHLPSSGRYYLTTYGINEAAGILGFDTPSDFVRAYPVAREWLALLIRRMDAVATIYRLAASVSPGIGCRHSQVEFHRRGRFAATITLHAGRSFGVVRQGLALRRRSLYDRLKAIAEYD